MTFIEPFVNIVIVDGLLLHWQAKPKFMKLFYNFVDFGFFVFTGKFQLCIVRGLEEGLGITMDVKQIINNNVISALDPSGREVVIMGKGIGFHGKRGPIDKAMIEKVFYLDDQGALNRFKELLVNLPLEHIKVSNDIITYANMVLKKKLNQNIYITLTDHINFAIERYRQGMLFENPLLWEVKTLYRREYLIGEYALALINKELGIMLPTDEAASIALHIVNAEFDSSMGDTMSITKHMPEVFRIVKKDFDVEFEEESLSYERFVTHLKFLMQRIMKSEQFDLLDLNFSQVIENMYPEEYRCSKEIGEYLSKLYEQDVKEEEISMLTIHVRRLILGIKE